MSQKSAPRFEHHPDHGHNVLVYESQEQQFASVAPYIEQGLATNHRCVYVAHDNSRAAVVSALQDRGVAVDAAIDAGQLSIHQPDEIYFSDGAFDPERTVDTLEQMLSGAMDAGYDKLRILGETTWAAALDVDPGRLNRYERLVDELFQSEAIVGLCQYRRSLFPPEQLCGLLETHPQVTHRAEHRSNCYYTLPENHTEEGPSAVIDRRLRTISEQNQLSNSLGQREQYLSLLDQFTNQFREADPDEIEQIAGEIIAEAVDPSLVSFWRFDRESGQFRARSVQNTIRGVETESVVETLTERIWDVFATDERRTFTLESDAPVRGSLLPVGQHGVFLVGTPGTEAISEPRLEFVRAVAGHTETVLDRVRNERTLEETNERLNEQTAHLERVGQINGIIREINRSLVDATTETEVAREVCTQLVQKSCVDFAWFGSYDPATETLDPVHDAGSGRGYLDALTYDDNWATNEPSSRVVQSRNVEIVPRINEGPSLDHWQEQALKREFHSMASFPVRFDDSMYGALSVYSDSQETFDDEVTTILDELSDCVAHAISSIKRKRALVTESVTELEARITDTSVPIVKFVSENDRRIDIDDIASASDEGLRIFATVYNATHDEIRSFVAASPATDGIEFLSESENAHSCKFKATDHSLTARLLNHNAVLQSVEAADGEAHLVLHLPQEADVRSFTEMFQTKYPSAVIVKRHNHDEPLRRLSDIETELKSELTDRQREVLNLAYHSGYFERPRHRTAEDIAESLDVSHPTVSRHLREAERKVFSLLLERD